MITQYDPDERLDENFMRNWTPDQYDEQAIRGFKPAELYYKELVRFEKHIGIFQSTSDCKIRTLNEYKYAFIRSFILKKYLEKMKDLEKNSQEYRGFLKERDAAFGKAAPMLEGNATSSKYQRAEYENFGKPVLVQTFIENLDHPKVIQFINAVSRGENVLTCNRHVYGFENQMVDAAQTVIEKTKEAGGQTAESNNDENDL